MCHHVEMRLQNVTLIWFPGELRDGIISRDVMAANQGKAGRSETCPQIYSDINAILLLCAGARVESTLGP
jgi:hypothetical protein